MFSPSALVQGDIGSATLVIYLDGGTFKRLRVYLFAGSLVVVHDECHTGILIISNGAHRAR